MIDIKAGRSSRNRFGKSKNFLSTLRKCNQGAAAVEYAIMLALVAGVIFVAVGSLGSVVRGLFESASKGW
jgi:Flp pilus assembly pilin Flp